MISWTEELRDGVRLFNKREYFECHEVLEDAWRIEQGEMKDLYQGLIKVAVAFYHAENENFEGAVKVLKSGLPQLRLYIAKCRIFDLDALIGALEEWLEKFEMLMVSGGMIDANQLPRITQI